MIKKNRRDFLIKSSLAIGGGTLFSQWPPIETLMRLISDQLIRKAMASGEDPLVKYLSFNLSGAPARWCFDQLVKTRTDQTIVSNPLVQTKLVGNGGTYTNTKYATVDYKGVLVPWLWKSSVKSAAGPARALNDLLRHLIVFRGYGSGVDGHPSNLARQSNPVPSAGSVTGHVADRSSNLFRALQFPPFGSASGYSSINGTGLSLIFGAGKANYAKNLMQPFTDREDTKVVESLRNRYAQYINETQNQIRFFASQKTSGLEPLTLDYENSLKTLKEGVGDLDASWTQLYTKYESIVLATIRDRTVPGLSDKPVLAQTGDVWNVNVLGGVQNPNVGSDLRDWYNAVDCNMLISSLALAEFALTRNYSSAMEFGSLEPANLIGYFSGSGTPTTFSQAFDQHNTGAVPMTYMNSMFFRALGAGLLELIDQLKNSGEFSRTFIHIVQEFGRSPRSTGTGSDHSFDGMVSSVLTGVIDDKPIVLGNIARSGGPDTALYPGTYGYKALTNVAGEKVYLSPAHVTSTLASLMQMSKNPWGNVAAPMIVRSASNLEIKGSGEIV